MKLNREGVFVEDPVHIWFGLTYCAYFVMPRLALQAMPLEWQERFVALMDEADEMGLETPEYSVNRRDEKGRFIKDPWVNYRRGRAADCDVSFAALLVTDGAPPAPSKGQDTPTPLRPRS